MMVPEQCRRATALQKQGLLLREIADVLGVSFEEVALYLYGGIADWEPIAPARPVNDNDQEDEDEPIVSRERRSSGGAAGKASARSGADEGRAPGGAARGAAGDAARAAAEENAARIEVALAPSDDNQPAPRPAGAVAPWVKAGGRPPPPMYYPPGKEPGQAPAAPPAAPAAEPAPEAPRRYWLTNGAGEYLRKSGSGMTRNKAEAWCGTAQQMEQAFKAKPTLKDLDPERVPG